MHVIKLGATDSTNSYLKGLLTEQKLQDFTVVLAENQTKGRGQVDTTWRSEPGKNLTLSILKYFEGIEAQHQFLINLCISLAVYDTLIALKVPRVSIKWPNDILSGTSKLCGILIENLISGQEIKSSVIGIGLNVNQTAFQKELNATSLQLLLSKELDKEYVLELLLKALKSYLEKAHMFHWEELLKTYEKKLFRKGVPSTFQRPDESYFMGIIQGVTETGSLKVLLKNDTCEEFGFKEVKLLY
ncbi:biotin--[acetyl-CoA-carboxylase] ligase [Maribacter sp. 2210JD10-5]|uniref:biotin--[acetyl-CoA-carboxylase] ligase n=1 Tax=Maribacter sp. 2210JD10-5 TaxID=3386272 RepID=UPI0039BD3F20